MLDETSGGGPLVVMIAIFDRGQDETVMSLVTGEGVTFNLLTRGKGTADSKILNYLGLGETEKTILISTMALEPSNVLLDKMRNGLIPGKFGRGIVFTLPVGSVCGARTVDYLIGSSEKEDGERRMEQDMGHDLIIAVANRGFSDVVMEAAKSAKATGGTVIPARGTDFDGMEKFFGVTILPEKDLILILTTNEFKCGIMEAIATRAGPQTDAGTLVFSLPVNGVSGLPPE
ncbi:hypothetical protein [Methanoculleus sp.]|uniref:hypothetical protein n=1 Tax=Methanoculleus sp. TaxID=90427 RepID=UPI0025F4AA9A|nr:hypothetical protein [Methanoculleus sp.]